MIRHEWKRHGGVVTGWFLPGHSEAASLEAPASRTPSASGSNTGQSRWDPRKLLRERARQNRNVRDFQERLLLIKLEMTSLKYCSDCIYIFFFT